MLHVNYSFNSSLVLPKVCRGCSWKKKITARLPWDRKWTMCRKDLQDPGTDMLVLCSQQSRATEKMTGVVEVAGCSLTGRTFLEWRSQSYHLSTVYFNWLETTQEQQKLDKVTELRKQPGFEPALPSVKSPACTWYRLQTSKQAVTSRSFPSLHMPFFKICHCLKSSLSWAGLHKQITCERENHIQGKVPRWEAYFRAFPEKGRAVLTAQQTNPTIGTTSQQSFNKTSQCRQKKNNSKTPSTWHRRLWALSFQDPAERQTVTSQTVLW